MSVLTCAFCLSTDRNLFFIDESPFKLIYSMLDVENAQYMKELHSSGQLRACWLCQTRARHLERFVRVAQRSLRTMRGFVHHSDEVSPPISLSRTEVELVDISPLSTTPRDTELGAHLSKDSDITYDLEQQLKDDIKVEEKISDDNFSDAENHEAEFIKQEESIVIEEKIFKDIAKTKVVKRRLKSRRPTALSSATKKEVATKIKKDLKKSVKKIKPYLWSHGWAGTELAARWYRDERASETERYKAQGVSGTDSYCVCAHCGRGTFASEEELMQHFDAKHDQAVGALECDLCKYRFDSKQALTKHIERHFKIYRCNFCPHTSRSVKLTLKHCRETHRGEKGPRVQSTSFCQRCKEKFDTPRLLRAHRGSCSTFKCAKCHKCFSDKSVYYGHLADHARDKTVPKDTKEPKDKLYCEVCDKEFTSRIWFKRHFRTSLKHVSRDTFQHECPHCKLRFHAAQLLREHVAAKHMNRGLYACDLCNKSFTVNASLRKHRAREHGIGSLRAPARDKICDHCGKGFTSNHLLNNHVRLHTGERPFECSLCPAKFAQNGSLYMHTRSVHQRRLGKDGTSDCADAQYGCPECGKPFWSRGQLRAHHKLFHLKESNFNCHVCNKMFASSCHLKDHVAGRHGVLYSESYRCDTCGKRFNTPSALKVHEKTHSSVGNMHQCRACDAAFRNPGQLYVHFKLKHLKLKRSDKVSIKNISNPERQLIVNGKPQ